MASQSSSVAKGFNVSISRESFDRKESAETAIKAGEAEEGESGEMRRYGCQERLVARSWSERPNDRTPDRNETPGPSARNGGGLNGEFIIRTGGREGEGGGAAESIGDKLRLRSGGSVARPPARRMES